MKARVKWAEARTFVGEATTGHKIAFGTFLALYALARAFVELFRMPDAQIGFLWGGLTMGMALSLPMLLIGLALVARAGTRPPARK